MIDRIGIFKDEMNNLSCMIEAIGVQPCEFLLRSRGINNRVIIYILKKLTWLIRFFISLFSFLYISGRMTVCLALFKHSHVSIPKEEKIFLAFTPVFLSRIDKTDLYEYTNKALWIVGPKIEIENRGDRMMDWNVFLQRNDIWSSYLEVLRICLIYPFNNTILYPIYNYWEFCLASRCVERIIQKKDIFFSNQSDRWALLFDNLPSKSKTLLQHGVDVNYGDKIVKLTNIDHFYAISNGSWQNSYKYLLNCKPDLHIMKPTIELSEIKEDNVSVLIISNLIYIDIETKIMDKLRRLPVKLYVKKHPGENNEDNYQQLRDKYGFILITGKFFPKVDYVISYESTLAYEYMGYNVPVSFFSPYNPNCLNQIEEGLLKLIDERNK